MEKCGETEQSCWYNQHTAKCFANMLSVPIDRIIVRLPSSVTAVLAAVVSGHMC